MRRRLCLCCPQFSQHPTNGSTVGFFGVFDGTPLSLFAHAALMHGLVHSCTSRLGTWFRAVILCQLPAQTLSLLVSASHICRTSLPACCKVSRLERNCLPTHINV